MDSDTLRRNYFEEKMTYIGGAFLLNDFKTDKIVQLLNDDATNHFYNNVHYTKSDNFNSDF